MPRLEAAGLRVAFGGVVAVDDVSLVVGPGEVVGLIGPNGAGKTTTIDALSGFVPHRGRVRVDGIDLGEEPPHRRAAHGLARTFQTLELFDDLTVGENCALARAAAEPDRTVRRLVGDVLRSGTASADAVERALEVVGLGDDRHRYPAELPLGRRKLVAVARSLAGSPRVVLLDEPAAGLDPTESRALGAALRQVVATGVSLLLVDHDMGLVLGVCDGVTVLDFGRVIASGPPDEVRADPRVVEAYLGQAVREPS